MIKSILLSLFVFLVFAANSALSQKTAIIIDHNCCKIQYVPDNWITTAKKQFRIAYQHTSHGSQIPSGMSLLSNITGSIYTYKGEQGALGFNDYGITGANDLGNPNRTAWADATRTLLTKPQNDRNMIMWSWCGQVDGSESDINTYLSLMNQLEKDFPSVVFVYMTGHLNGSGVNGNVNQRNEQIRKFCRDNGKILFDFADIESYDPDGNYFLDKKANDNCDYYEGSVSKNWATEWCDRNPGKCGNCTCAHSQCLNCQQKGKAFWWMLARVAGWDGEVGTTENETAGNPQNLSIIPNPVQNTMYIKLATKIYKNIFINIIDNFGVSVIKKDISSNVITNSYELSVEGLTPGVYFCRVNYGEKTETVKFIVVK